MNTKVRITKGRNGNYDSLIMEVLEISRGRTASIIGHLQWQGDNRYGWYGLRYEISASASEYKNIYAMYKLASYIQDRTTYKSTPQEVAALIGAEEHFYNHGQFISIRDNGKQMYQVYTSAGSLYTVCLSANADMAYRAVEGMKTRKEIPQDTYRIKALGERIAFTATDLSYATILQNSLSDTNIQSPK